MKSLAIVLVIAIMAGFVLSCNNNKSGTTDTDTTTVTATDTMPSPPVTETTPTVAVPDNTRLAFEKKYPGATNVVWVRKNKSTAKTTSPDSTDYQVTYRWEGVDYTTWYEWDGDWVATRTKITNDKLPAAVNDAIAKKYAGYTITEIDKENDKDMTSYEVDLEKGSEKITVHFSASGKVQKTNM